MREYNIIFQYFNKLSNIILNSLSKQVQMIDDKTQSNSKDIYNKTYEELKLQIQNSIRQKFPKAVYFDSNNNLQIKNLDQLDEEYHSSSDSRTKEGRGGNNVAQNLKKSLKSVIKAKLSAQIYQQFQANYIKKYDIKSQKENFVLIFLFLHQLVYERKLKPQLINQVKECVMQNIHKYIGNSSSRKQERQVFHLKNIQQFEKYLHFDIDFTRKRDFQEVQTFIKQLFLRKRAAAIKAIEKVLKILEQNPFLHNIFFSENERHKLKIEEAQPREL